MSSVLIIRKSTNLEQYHQLFAQKLMPAKPETRYFDFLNRAHSEHYACLDKLKTCLQSLGFSIAEASRTDEWPMGKFDYVIAFGGDGTLLTASYGIQDETPLIGVRSSTASVGFLCAADMGNVEERIKSVMDGRLPFDVRHRLKARIQRVDGTVEDSKLPALNDFLYAASTPSATSRYRIHVGSESEQHKSSGVWISTATGSSAAIAAAGGQPLPPEDERFQYMVRELYHREEDHLRLHSGVLDPRDVSFVIESQCPSAILALDGEKWTATLRFGDKVSFFPSTPVRIARHT